MFDFKISTQNHWDDACRKFALNYNMTELARRAGMKVQALRNKLNPDQPHQLTIAELMTLTDVTEDASLLDGMLAQMHCLPCVPVNEVASEKFSTYVLKATAEVGQLAATTVSQERITTMGRRNVIQNVNSGIRCLTLAAIAMQTRIQSNPTIASTVDALTGLSASVGLS